MALPKIYAHIAPDGKLLDTRTEPPVSWETPGGKVYEYAPVKAPNPLKIPVVWVRYSGPRNPVYSKEVTGNYLLIGEEGENVHAVLDGSTRLPVPIFESTALTESEGTAKVLKQMVMLADVYLFKTGEVGTVYGIFRSSYKLLGDNPSYVKEVGLVCTTSEFNPTEEPSRLNSETRTLDLAECVQLGLPTVVELPGKSIFD